MLWVEQVYDRGVMSPTVAELVDVVKRLDMSVDADDLEAVMHAREMLLATAMAPLQAFDELRLYQLSKASSTTQFLERCAGLSPGDAQWTVTLARRLKAMPLTEAAWLAGTLTSAQVQAVHAAHPAVHPFALLRVGGQMVPVRAAVHLVERRRPGP